MGLVTQSYHLQSIHMKKTVKHVRLKGNYVFSVLLVYMEKKNDDVGDEVPKKEEMKQVILGISRH